MKSSSSGSMTPTIVIAAIALIAFNGFQYNFEIAAGWIENSGSRVQFRAVLSVLLALVCIRMAHRPRSVPASPTKRQPATGTGAFISGVIATALALLLIMSFQL